MDVTVLSQQSLIGKEKVIIRAACRKDWDQPSAYGRNRGTEHES